MESINKTLSCRKFQDRSQTSEWGCVSESRRREDRGAAGAEGVGAGGGALLRLGEGSREASPEIFDLIYEVFYKLK